MSIFDDIAQARSAFLPGQKLIGLDYGSKTIGVALSDMRWQIASPLKTIRREKLSKDVAALQEIIAKERVGGIILGLPLNMNATSGPRVQSTRAFARNLAGIIELAITFWDERLSTVAAERVLLEADSSRARRKEVIDQVAAGFILQGALDRMVRLETDALR